MNKTFLFTALATVLSTAHAEGLTQPVVSQPAAMPTTAMPAVMPATPQTPAVIDCKYRITAETNSISDATLTAWVNKAAVQSFNFNPTSIDQELTDLKFCYTDAGWIGFNDALQKSGNINAIKTTVPLQVIYQNDKQKITQLLDIDVLVGRKPSGDLGILQMIATPRPSALPAAPIEPVAAPVTPDQSAQQTAPAADTAPAIAH